MKRSPLIIEFNVSMALTMVTLLFKALLSKQLNLKWKMYTNKYTARVF